MDDYVESIVIPQDGQWTRFIESATIEIDSFVSTTSMSVNFDTTDELTISDTNETVMTNSTMTISGDVRFPVTLRMVATGACVFLLVIGLIGNALVPFVVLRTKELRNSMNLFLINLSMADMFVLIVCAPSVLVELHTRPEVWSLGEFMCK